jgi:exo-1,4-beta-D-glucosaminidase
MKTKRLYIVIIAVVTYSLTVMSQINPDGKILLRNNWSIQSSAQIKEDGTVISGPAFKPEKWYPASVPSTVLGILVENKVYSDPYFGTNIESLPGFIKDRRGEIPQDSPFKVAWWYRTVFDLPSEYKGRTTWLKLHSINYKANIWLNGHLIADTTSIEGAYRLYNLNITEFAIPGDKNCLALEIFPPKGTDLTITWVDWNPTPPDRGMGIWYDVSIHSTGPVAIEDTRIITKLNLPLTDRAKLTISANLLNTTDQKITGILKGKIEKINFSQEVTLAANENKLIVFAPDKFSQLEISDPRLWWPHTVGPQIPEKPVSGYVKSPLG